MPKLATLEIDIKQFKTDIKDALKETFVDIQAYAQEIIVLLQAEIKDLKAAIKANKGDVAQLKQHVALYNQQLSEVKAIKVKEKARQAAHKAFDENYQVLESKPVAKTAASIEPEAEKAEEKIEEKADTNIIPAKEIINSVKEAIESAMKDESMPLEVGHKAPEGGELSLSQFQGKQVVLYFYPKDDTPGCTQEANDFMDRIGLFAQNNAVVIGVSRDSQQSHDKFKAKYGIDFNLLADTEETLCNLYGVMRDKNMYGKMVRGIERSTFLIDEEGNVKSIWRKVKVPGHVEDVLKQVKQKQTELF